MVIFVILQVQIATGFEILIDPTVLKYNSTDYECREDQAAKNFLYLILIELINSIVILHGIGFARWFFKRVLTCNKDGWRP